MTVDQQALVAAEVGLCSTTQSIATIASLENAVAKSVADVRQQLLIEMKLVFAASKAFEERIASELTSRVDGRIGIVNRALSS